jgi:1-acyl-sn-glycerol-3-phosphate acyltransferase
VIGSVIFTVYLFLSVAVYGLAALLFGFVSEKLAYGVALSWANSILFLLKRLCRLDYHVEGVENLPTEASLVLMKHSSAWETIAQFKLFPRQTWVMKRELLWAPILGWVLRIYRPIAIDRKAGRAAVEQVVEQGTDRLKKGYWVVIFPEGTRVPAGESHRYGQSGALLAVASGRAIVPVAHNAGEYWRRRDWLKRPGTIRVVIGQPIKSEGREPRELTAEVRQWVETTVASLKL